MTLRRYYVLFVIEIERRVGHLLGVHSFRFCIRDRDAKFTARASTPCSTASRRSRRPSPHHERTRSPKRFVRTVREDCLDHLLVVSRRHLDAVLAEYARHYNEARPHRELGLQPPVPRLVQAGTQGRVIRREVLGGLIHEYERAA